MTIDLDSIFRYKALNLTKLLDNGFSSNGVVFEKENLNYEETVQCSLLLSCRMVL